MTKRRGRPPKHPDDKSYPVRLKGRDWDAVLSALDILVQDIQDEKRIEQIETIANKIAVKVSL